MGSILCEWQRWRCPTWHAVFILKPAAVSLIRTWRQERRFQALTPMISPFQVRRPPYTRPDAHRGPSPDVVGCMLPAALSHAHAYCLAQHYASCMMSGGRGSRTEAGRKLYVQLRFPDIGLSRRSLEWVYLLDCARGNSSEFD